jgi:hypothetical protein
MENISLWYGRVNNYSDKYSGNGNISISEATGCLNDRFESSPLPVFVKERSSRRRATRTHNCFLLSAVFVLPEDPAARTLSGWTKSGMGISNYE